MTTHKTLSALQDQLQVAAGQVGPLPTSVSLSVSLSFYSSLCTEISTSLGRLISMLMLLLMLSMSSLLSAHFSRFPSLSLSLSVTLSLFHLRRVSRKAKKLPLSLALCLPARRDINKWKCKCDYLLSALNNSDFSFPLLLPLPLPHFFWLTSLLTLFRFPLAVFVGSLVLCLALLWFTFFKNGGGDGVGVGGVGVGTWHLLYRATGYR